MWFSYGKILQRIRHLSLQPISLFPLSPIHTHLDQSLQDFLAFITLQSYPDRDRTIREPYCKLSVSPRTSEIPACAVWGHGWDSIGDR